ncbi:MAG: tetraacyldisaccharide 4'-kinase [Phycisphaerae bacterium]|nr:tetraacyldisaccharide 4'-kinase [Phycisphaerae bacterium]
MSGPLAAPWGVLTRPLSWLYGMGVAVRNARFDRGLGCRRLPLPVVSIGNITAGGTGKTPFVAWTAQALLQRGHAPLIAMRGYRSADGEAGDEEREYAMLVPRAPVVASPQRFDAVTRALVSRPGAHDCVLLDDGFQHRQLARELDVVLIDATRPSLDDALLPSGWLREPATALRRAHAVIVTRATDVDSRLAASIRALHGKDPIAWTRHAWRALDVYAAAVTERRGVHWLQGKRVLVYCGIGHPAALFAALEEHGATIVHRVSAPDHAAIPLARARELAAMASSLDAIVVTRKDWVKLGEHRSVLDSMPPVVVPDLAIEFIAGETAYLTALRGALANAAGESAVQSIVRPAQPNML